jgi:sterol desaturase/sphingolipid hydroxylase (fatty acid hydroxylase superfamily)
MINPIAVAIPVFLILIGGELLWARARKRSSIYRFNDSVIDIGCGIASQVTEVFYGAAILAIYEIVYQHRLVSMPVWAQWVVAFVGVDFLYYWWHRASHEVNFLWAAHIVHHQSEDYNLAVALRQAILTAWTNLPFYLPLAVIGVPTIVWATMHALSTLYQFWIHTQLVGKARGPIDWILNLPSHHRVHHAINPQYLDKNYGATLIIWDRLFGTYEEEVAPPVYGITKPLGTFNPLWAQFHYWFELARLSWEAPNFMDKLRVWWKSPAWGPEGLPKPPIRDVSPDTYKKFDTTVSPRVRTYILLQFGLIIGVTFSMLWWQTKLPLLALVAMGTVSMIALSTFGALLEGRRWAVPAEVARLALAAGALVWFMR